MQQDYSKDTDLSMFSEASARNKKWVIIDRISNIKFAIERGDIGRRIGNNRITALEDLLKTIDT